MKKIIIWFMIIIMSLFPIFRRKPIIAHAAILEDNKLSPAPLPPTREPAVTIPINSGSSDGAICAMANVLTWEMLQTYLYALTGQQAYDIYANNDENSQALYEDFGTWLQTQKQGAQISYQLTKANSIIAYTTLSNAIDYYKTAGSSALKEMQEEAKAQLQVINGGLSNNTSPAPSPTSGAGNNVTEFVTNLKAMEIVGSSALTYCIGNYITELVKGNRGEVSKTFLNELDTQEFYFDGNYNFDEEGHFLFTVGSDVSIRNGLYFYKGENVFYSVLKNDYMYKDGDLIAMYPTATTSVKLPTYEERVDYYRMEISIRRGSDFLPLSGGVYYNSGGGFSVGGYISMPCTMISNVNYIPVFATQADAMHFFETGDYKRCLNSYVANVKPSNWLGYDFSALSSKLDQILGALTTLPTITTDDLAGFAQGVGNAIVAGNVPASDPATQQQQMEQILEEQARDTATRSLADSAGHTNQEDEWTDENPRPTKTPDELVHDENVKDGTMVVDLHEFFPFCVPFDMVRLIKVLQAEPKAPCFEGAIKYDKLNINVPIKIDMSGFNDVAKVFRLCETILFILGLILITRNLIRG